MQLLTQQIPDAFTWVLVAGWILLICAAITAIGKPRLPANIRIVVEYDSPDHLEELIAAAKRTIHDSRSTLSVTTTSTTTSTTTVTGSDHLVERAINSAS